MQNGESTMGAESKFQAKILRAIKKCKHCKSIKYNASAYGEKGTPDILGCYRGMFFAIEVKAEDGHATPIQRVRIRQWREAGAAAAFAMPGFELDVWLKHSYAKIVGGK